MRNTTFESSQLIISEDHRRIEFIASEHSYHIYLKSISLHRNSIPFTLNLTQTSICTLIEHRTLFHSERDVSNVPVGRIR